MLSSSLTLSYQQTTPAYVTITVCVCADLRDGATAVERPGGSVPGAVLFAYMLQTQSQEAGVDCIPAHSPEPAQQLLRRTRAAHHP